MEFTLLKNCLFEFGRPRKRELALNINHFTLQRIYGTDRSDGISHRVSNNSRIFARQETSFELIRGYPIVVIFDSLR